jgi:hypothetical protein
MKTLSTALLALALYVTARQAAQAEPTRTTPGLSGIAFQKSDSVHKRRYYYYRPYIRPYYSYRPYYRPYGPGYYREQVYRPFVWDGPSYYFGTWPYLYYPQPYAYYSY